MLPQVSESHTRGYQHQLLGEWEEAKRSYEQALALQPDYAFSQFALAQLQLMQSSFREGRELYESRFAAREGTDETDWRVLPIPRWRGESIAGKHLHLWAEQGVGDVIMYAGFLPYLIAQRPARLTLSIFAKMMPLFERSFPSITVESFRDIGDYLLSYPLLETFLELQKMVQETGLEIDLAPMQKDYEQALKHGKADYGGPMGDLMVYGLPDFIPAQRQLAHMKADTLRVTEMKKRLHSLGAGRLIGISWYTINKKDGSFRSIALEKWLPILRTPGCHFVSLQHHVSPLEIEHFCAENGCNITIDPQLDVVEDIEGLTALTAAMDEVITIDNSNAHLAGALGVPTTLLLTKGCDFRWPMLEGEVDTLWYKNIKIERQNRPMDWQPVIAKVAENLRLRAQ